MAALRSDPPFDSHLVNLAINAASPARLESVLRRIIANSKEAQRLAMHLLTVRADEVIYSGDDGSKDDAYCAALKERMKPATPEEPVASKKRKHDEAEPPRPELPPVIYNRVQRFELCDQCGEEFDVTENSKDECRWHEGRDRPSQAHSSLVAKPSVLGEIET